MAPRTDVPPDAVLMVDSYEQLAPLDSWLRNTFLPGLEDGVVVVLLGRSAPDAADAPDLVAALASQIVDVAPGPAYARGLALCALAWTTTLVPSGRCGTGERRRRSRAGQTTMPSSSVVPTR